MAFQKPPVEDDVVSEQSKSTNPLLDESVIENPNVKMSFDNTKDFSTASIPEQQFNISQEDEAEFEKTTKAGKTTQQKQTPNSNSQSSERKEPQPPLNPEMNDLSTKEKKLAAKNMAMAVIAGYEWVHQFPVKWVQISEKRLLELQRKKELSLNTIVDNSGIRPIDTRTAIKNYNAAVEQSGVFVVSEEFKEEATPVLIRVLEKRGIGMTDENLLLYIFAKDIATKAFALKGLMSQTNEFINALKTYNNQAQPQSQPQGTPDNSSTQSDNTDKKEESEKESNVDVVDEKPKEKKKRRVYKDERLEPEDIEFKEVK